MAGLWKAPTSNFWSSSLNGTIDSSVTTITLNSTTGLQYPGYIVIDREDSSGTSTPTKREVVSYTGISGSNLTGCTRGADNSTNRSHADGALVEPVYTVGMHNDQRDAINAEHSTDGTHSIIAAATITAVNIVNARIATASVTSMNAANYVGVQGHFLWSRTGALATVLHATAGDIHFPLQRATQNLTLTGFHAALCSAPSIKPIELDITYNSAPTGDFTSIFSVRPFVDIGEYSSTSAATPGTLSLTSLASGTYLRHEIRMHGDAGTLMSQLIAKSR